MTATQITAALIRIGGPLYCRRYTCVPNVSWGWGLAYEADLIAVSPSGYCTEVEIKVSKSDLIADAAKQKWKTGLDPRISRFFYAVPESLESVVHLYVPVTAGVIVVRPGRHDYDHPVAEVVRDAERIKTARKITNQECRELHRLASLRYWDIFLQLNKPKEAA